MWNSNDQKADIFYLKGFAEAVLQKAGIRPEAFQPRRSGHVDDAWEWRQGGKRLVHARQNYGELSATRPSVVEGKSVSVRVDMGGCRSVNNNRKYTIISE